MRAPWFWHRRTLLSTLLLPVSWLYYLGHLIRLSWSSPEKADVPVICVGNVIAGGAGKTPVAMGVAALLAPHQPMIAFLSRGYGGSAKGPLRVDPEKHTAKEVGDEALLLASRFPTYIGADRLASAALAAQDGAKLLIMDDGFQNPSIKKDVSLLVVDGHYGFGNGRLIPAGPLRETIAAGMRRADAVVIMGEDTVRAAAQIPSAMPVFHAHLEPRTTPLMGQRILAFAGIGRPEKFFEMLADQGFILNDTVTFADHHLYTPADLKRLQSRASAAKASLITTAKDAMRLPPGFRAQVTVVETEVVWQDETMIRSFLRAKGCA